MAYSQGFVLPVINSKSGVKMNTHQQGVNADRTEDLLDCVAAVKEEGI